MSKEPLYYAWYPALEQSGSVLSVLLSPGCRRRAPLGAYSHDFYAGILCGLGLRTGLTSGAVEPFLTQHFSGRLEECWNAKILLDERLRSVSGHVARLPVHGDHPASEEGAKDPSLWIVAGFERLRDAEECRKFLIDHREVGEWDAIRFHRCVLRRAGADRLVVTEFSIWNRARAEVVEAARWVVDACEERGGRITWAPGPAV